MKLINRIKELYFSFILKIKCWYYERKYGNSFVGTYCGLPIITSKNISNTALIIIGNPYNPDGSINSERIVRLVNIE